MRDKYDVETLKDAYLHMIETSTKNDELKRRYKFAVNLLDYVLKIEPQTFVSEELRPINDS